MEHWANMTWAFTLPQVLKEEDESWGIGLLGDRCGAFPLDYVDRVGWKIEWRHSNLLCHYEVSKFNEE